jgi:deazaflavin-dependent oxidoreductase (nitroreductase family)
MPNIRWLLRIITWTHRFVYQVSRGWIGGRSFGFRFLLLYHFGRRSGREFVAPLLYIEHEGCWILAASNAGDQRNPAWYLNLRARPETRVQVGRRKLCVKAREATAEELRVLWPKLNESYGYYDDYRARAGREIPVVVLEPAE